MSTSRSPAITVVVPTSGRWPLVADCLDALARQERAPDEVLLVCDGPMTPPEGLGRALGSRLNILRLEAGGVARARNAGIAAARGGILAFTDDDALASEGWLAALEECFRDEEVVGAGGPVLPLWETPPPAWVASSRRARGCLGLLDLGPVRRDLDPAADFLVGSNCAYRAGAVRGKNGFRGIVNFPGGGVCGEDYELSRRVSRSGPVVYEPRAVVRHRIGTQRAKLLPILWKAFFYEAVGARLGGRLRPKRSMGDILKKEALVGPSVVLGHLYGRLLRALPPALALAAAFGIGGSAHAASYGRLSDVFAEIGVRAPASEPAAVTKSLRREGRSHVFWTVEAGLGEKRVRLEITTNIGPGAADRLIDERSVVVRALYKPATVDYFGVMSGRAAVPEELRPEVLYPERSFLRSGNPAFLLWSRKDLSYVVRERTEAVFRGLLGFRYCEERRTLIQLETFEPAAEFDKKSAVRDFLELQCSSVPEKKP